MRVELRRRLGVLLQHAAALVAALQAELDSLELETEDGDDDDVLVDANERLFGLPAGTFRSWAREGRLRAFEVERGRLVAWKSDVRRAVEAQPCQTTVGEGDPRESKACDPLDRALLRGTLRLKG